jgi:hypothetical protein
MSPILPPDARYVTVDIALALLLPKTIHRSRALPLKSVETPVANNPRDATASEPPRSTMHARVPPWRMLRRFCLKVRNEAVGSMEWERVWK